MSKITMTIDFEDKNYFKPVTRYSINVISCLLGLFLTFALITLSMGAERGFPDSWGLFSISENEFRQSRGIQPLLLAPLKQPSALFAIYIKRIIAYPVPVSTITRICCLGFSSGNHFSGG